jgi:SP family sugar:H+ symporter-like MFS transporter
MYNDPNCKPWTSRSWAPPGFTDRRDLVEKTRAAEGTSTGVEKPTRRSSATGSATYNEPVRTNEKV